MKAAVLEDLNNMVVKEVEVPDIDEESMLVRVRACAVCGSDIRIFRHGNPRVHPPQIIGHEIAGEVVEVGSNVKGFKVGDRVAIGADVPCGECEWCQNGLGNNCGINYAIGYQFPGGFAEYVVLNPITVRFGPVHKISGDLSFEEAALAEPLACCINGLELSRLGLGEAVVIIGAGPAGCMLAQLSKVMGASKVIMSQRSKKRLQLAKKFKADILISASEENFVDRVLKETGGKGADVVVTACASSQAQEEALLVVKNRGRVNFFRQI
ncbi:MAG TPA: L-threonine 3-dehydrogenase [Candidatus Latescibacteria bacterium]|nr:L-threonine 3-dehydrogenase [Candidatus Latescibacterota bacterium]